jgi:HEAT repeat protein
VEEVFRQELNLHHDEPQYRIVIWRVLAQSDQTTNERKKWIAKIKTGFMDPDATDRIHAIENLGKLKATLTEDELQTVQLFAVEVHSSFAYWVMTQHNIEGAKDKLTGFRNSDDYVRRLRAEFCLAQLTPLTRELWLEQDGRRQVKAGLTSPDTSTRRDACMILGDIGVKNEAGQVIALLKDGDPDVRVYATTALLRMERRR